MTFERVVAVALPLDESGRRLVADVRSAAARAADAEPGDRVDIVRFEALSSQLESLSFRKVGREGFDGVVVELNEQAPVSSSLVVKGEAIPDAIPETSCALIQRVLDAEGALVIFTLPLEMGLAPPLFRGIEAPPAAELWEDPEGRHGSAAVRARFESQLERAVASKGAAGPIIPSGIQNRALTEALRTFVDRADSSLDRVEVAVEYRDGSRAANSFALRSLDLTEQPAPSDQKYSFALLSIRHTELDAIVDGAWLRNTQISQTRTQADTDDLVYSISRKQLSALTNGGCVSVELEIYQTGLEPAIVGFYRAVVDHLLAHPGSLTVVPMYFQQAPNSKADKSPKPNGGGKKSTGRRGATSGSGPPAQPERGTPADLDKAEADYAPGLVWAIRKGDRQWAAPCAATRQH